MGRVEHILFIILFSQKNLWLQTSTRKFPQNLNLAICFIFPVWTADLATKEDVVIHFIYNFRNTTPSSKPSRNPRAKAECKFVHLKVNEEETLKQNVIFGIWTTKND